MEYALEGQELVTGCIKPELLLFGIQSPIDIRPQLRFFSLGHRHDYKCRPDGSRNKNLMFFLVQKMGCFLPVRPELISISIVYSISYPYEKVVRFNLCHIVRAE